MNECPKCGGPFQRQILYCGVALGINSCCAAHDQNREHLFKRCNCGFEGMAQPCKDAAQLYPAIPDECFPSSKKDDDGN